MVEGGSAALDLSPLAVTLVLSEPSMLLLWPSFSDKDTATAGLIASSFDVEEESEEEFVVDMMVVWLACTELVSCYRLIMK